MGIPAFDCVIRGGRVFTGGAVVEADIGITGERIAAIGVGLPAGRADIDARGKLVLPGGVDPHCHIEQLSGGGIMNADTFETATRSAALGGTTSVISFAAQHRGMDLRAVVDDYAARAARGAITDYAFHLMIANPGRQTIEADLPALIRAGHRSVKVFMTYDKVKVSDEELLDVLLATRSAGGLVCVHAENHGLLAWMGERLIARGYTAPKFHGVSHPRAAEVEAIHRLITFARFVDQPVMVFHVSTAEGAALVRQARQDGAKIFAETCPQYLFQTLNDLDRPGLEAAKLMCSPPQRTEIDQDALWQALGEGHLQVISSDHAPYRMDESGKLSAGTNPNFKQIANGLPGLQTRLPLLFDAMVSRGRLGLAAFVETTATAPARLYDLPRKGAIAPGMDADIVLWDADRAVVLPDVLADNAGYNPFAGRTVKGWPETVLRRGEIIVRDGALVGRAGTGKLMLREAGEATRPTGRLAPELDPARNFGADLL